MLRALSQFIRAVVGDGTHRNLVRPFKRVRFRHSDRFEAQVRRELRKLEERHGDEALRYLNMKLARDEMPGRVRMVWKEAAKRLAGVGSRET